MSIDPITTPTFIVQCGANGQLTVSQVTGGNLASATLEQLFTAQRDIKGAVGLVEAMIIRNLS